MSINFIALFFFCVLSKALDPLGQDISGDRQIGTVNEFLKKPIVVRIIDNNGRGIEKSMVIFSILYEPPENKVTNKSAVLNPETVYTDKDGYGKAFLKLGNTPGNYYILVQDNRESLIFQFTAVEKGWFFLMLISLFGGLALFIFALNYGSKGLIRGAGSKSRDLLFNLTGNRLTAALSGFIVTIIFGSCTATTSLLLKFASAGIVQIVPALGVILGANIGATITVQLLAFNIMNYALLIITLGVFLRILFPKLRNLAQFIFGIGLLFFSVKIIAQGIGTVKYLSEFTALIEYLNQARFLAIVIGVVGAFIFRSSTAIIGLVLALLYESAISIKSALYLVLGANLGTTLFPILIADSADARRISLGNIVFKLTGVVIFTVILNELEITPALGNSPRLVANFHTFFNLVIALIYLPLLYPFGRFLKFFISETKHEILKSKRLDQTFLDTPAIGLGQGMQEIFNMGNKTVRMFEDAIKVFEKRDIVLRKSIIQADDEIDQVEELVTPYLSRLNPEEMDQEMKKMQIGLLTITAELEHIGDTISKNLMNYAKKQIDEGMEFSQEGLSQIKEFHGFVLETLRMAISSLATRDKKLAREVLARREKGLGMAKKLKIKHIERLHRGLKESLETSTIHLDILSDLERINFHATEISNAVISMI